MGGDTVTIAEPGPPTADGAGRDPGVAGVTVNMETVLSPPLAAASRFPDGLNATEKGWIPVVVGEPVAGRSDPPVPTVNMETELLPGVATASRLPDGLKATEYGKVPAMVGEPVAGERDPPIPTVNIATELLNSLATASRFPDGLNATDSGALPVVVGEQVAGERDPPVPTVNTETVLLPCLATASRFPDGLKATDHGNVPALVGEPVAGERDPPVPTVNMETLLPFSLATASRFPDGLNATESGVFPVAVGEPAAGESDPPVPANAGMAPTAASRRTATTVPTTLRRRAYRCVPDQCLEVAIDRWCITHSLPVCDASIVILPPRDVVDVLLASGTCEVCTAMEPGRGWLSPCHLRVGDRRSGRNAEHGARTLDSRLAKRRFGEGRCGAWEENRTLER